MLILYDNISLKALGGTLLIPEDFSFANFLLLAISPPTQYVYQFMHIFALQNIVQCLPGDQSMCCVDTFDVGAMIAAFSVLVVVSLSLGFSVS